MKDLMNAMCKVRKSRMKHGVGETWFYVTRGGIEVYISPKVGEPSTYCVVITPSQLRRALEIIKDGE